MAWYIFIGHNWNVAATNIDESVGEMDGYAVVLFEGDMLPRSERNRISMEQPMLDDSNRGLQKPVKEEEVTEPVSIHDAASLYRQKGATVFMLHPETPELYDPPLLLSKNGLLIGTIYADGSMSSTTAELKAAQLEARGADYIIMIITDARLIDIPIKSADIIICTSDEDLPSRGTNLDGTLYVQSPIIGQVQTIIIAPSRVITSKAITWL